MDLLRSRPPTQARSERRPPRPATRLPLH
jgi:hypothetical protein